MRAPDGRGPRRRHPRTLVLASGCGESDDGGERARRPSAPREFFGVVPQGLLGEADLDRMEEGNVGHDPPA